MVSGRQAADFDRFEAALASIGSPFVAAPRTGLDAASVEAALAAVDLTPPDGLIDWFGWRNGDGRTGHAQRQTSRIIGNMCALDLNEGVRLYRQLRASQGALEAFAFERGWFPIMIGFWHGIVCVDCVSQSGSIVLDDTQVMMPSTPDERIFGSVAEMIDMFVYAIDHNWLDTDPTSPRHLLFRLDAVPEEHADTLLNL